MCFRRRWRLLRVSISLFSRKDVGAVPSIESRLPKMRIFEKWAGKEKIFELQQCPSESVCARRGSMMRCALRCRTQIIRGSGSQMQGNMFYT